MFEWVWIRYVKYQQDHVRPTDKFLVLCVDIVSLTWKLFLKLILAKEVPYFVLVHILFSYNSFCENMAIFAWSLFNLNAFAFIEVHVSEEKACLANAIAT